MMKFERRQVILKTMEEKDIVNYFYEFPVLSKEERKEGINKMKAQLKTIENDIASTIMFAVLEKNSKKIIGFIYAQRKNKVEEITVSIPNDSKLLKYGFEVIDQFLKVCKEQWPDDIRFVKLDKEDAAAKIYIKEKNLESEYVSVA